MQRNSPESALIRETINFRMKLFHFPRLARWLVHNAFEIYLIGEGKVMSRLQRQKIHSFRRIELGVTKLKITLRW